MDINERLYVAIEPYEGRFAPTPHPVRDGRFDTGRIYKVLGMYNPSETSEAYFVLSNADGEIWFISNRPLRVAGLFDGDALSMPKDKATQAEQDPATGEPVPLHNRPSISGPPQGLHRSLRP